MNSGVRVRVAVSLGSLGAPLPAALSHRPSAPSGLQSPLTCGAPLPPHPGARRVGPAHGPRAAPGPGSPTDTGHGEERCQVPAELLAPGPRAGRAGPGVLPLSAGGLCVRVPRPHHPPLGPGQFVVFHLENLGHYLVAHGTPLLKSG